MNARLACSGATLSESIALFNEGAAAAGNAAPSEAWRIKREAAAFLASCAERRLDPLRPGLEAANQYVAQRGHSGDEAVKTRWALRKVLVAAGAPTDEHGFGSGDRSRLLETLPAPVAAVVAEFLKAVPSREPVWRSGVVRLLHWCEQYSIEPLSLTAVDLDDYRDWLTLTSGWCAHGGGEKMVIARRFVAFIQDDRVRRLAAREERRERLDERR